METDIEPAAAVGAPLDQHPSAHQPQQSSQSGFLRRSQPYDTWRDWALAPSDLQQGQWVSLMWPRSPGYRLQRPLLKLEALDGNGTVHKQFLLDAAYVLSGNRSGTLHKVDGQTVQEVTQATVALTPGIYQYSVSDSTEGDDPAQWAVVEGFANWQFPHGDFGDEMDPATSCPRLAHWQSMEDSLKVTAGRSTSASSLSSDVSEAVKFRDGQRCIVSATQGLHACENAHLIPAVAAKWYLDNEMWVDNIVFTNSPTEKAVHDRCNGITLRADYHRVLDAGLWVPFPTGQIDNFMAYFFAGEGEDLCSLSHAVPIKLHPEVSRRALFARFAWNVILRAGFAIPQKEDTEPAGRAELTHEQPQPDSSSEQDTDSSSEISASDTVDTLMRQYRSSHPEIEAIGDPAGIASHEQHWRNLLDADELEHYDT